jgi:glyoxylase-like metal-dependent hydrolase (beta-lactamase superfamily II)
MPKFDTGMVELGDDLYAYLQWDGGWGVSNAGLLAQDDGLLVIDALMAPSMTRRFVGAMRDVSRAPFRTLVNTHMHPDHTNGNQFIEGAEIVASEACRAEMAEAARVAAEAAARRAPGDRGPKPGWIREEWWPELAEVHPTLPTTTFSDRLTLRPGGREVQLRHYGPAHTLGDAMIYVPDAKVLFAGDLAFFYAMPLCRGDMENWVRVCDIIRDMDIETIVPGHGPLGTKRELQDMQEYLDFMVRETRAAFDEGLTREQAAQRIDIGDWAKWPEAERKEMNIATLYGMWSKEPRG